MLEFIKNIRRLLVLSIVGDVQDPVRHCQVHRQIGCAHVDGFLCEMNTCEILSAYKKKNK